MATAADISVGERWIGHLLAMRRVSPPGHMRAVCARAHLAEAELGVLIPHGRHRPLDGPIQRRSAFSGCCAVVA